MEPPHLCCFLVAADALNFSRVTERLRPAQPALRQRLGLVNLENDMVSPH